MVPRRDATSVLQAVTLIDSGAVCLCGGRKGRPGGARYEKNQKTRGKQAFLAFSRFTSFAAFRMMITNREHEGASQPYKYRGLKHPPGSRYRKQEA